MFTVAALYKFTSFDAPEALCQPLAEVAQGVDVKGTLILAREGINGTIAGKDPAIDTVLGHIRSLPGCADIDWKKSVATEQPFMRLKVRVKKEIVTMGQPDVHPASRAGTYVAPADWNSVITDSDTVVIDTRNDYEVAIGTFKGAINPRTDSFRDFPSWWEQNADKYRDKKVAMFCTGGIRCEKSTNYLLGQGVREVVHLKGGILKYLETIPEPQSLWQGACFVFDGRVSVTHGLNEGPHAQCYACRRPLAPEDLRHPEYEAGVACHQCRDEFSDSDRERFRERQRQMALAKARGTRHLGN